MGSAFIKRLGAFFSFFFCQIFLLHAQENNIAVGGWRVHVPYTQGRSLDVAGDKIYITFGIGAFDLDKSDNSINKLSKVSGLSDVGISKVKYSPEYDLVMLIYENSNIDIIKGDKIINISDVKRKSIIGSRAINHIFVSGRYAYLSFDFGVSVLDLKKLEIRETYFDLSSGNNPNKIYSSTLTEDKDSIFLATDKGLMAAPVDSDINLMDYANWHIFADTEGVTTDKKADFVASLNGRIYGAYNRDGVYIYNGATWTKTSVPLPADNDIRSMNSSGGKLLICTDGKIITYDGAQSGSIESQWLPFPADAVFDKDGTLWAADLGWGLVRWKNGNSDRYEVNGPLSTTIFRLSYYDNHIIGLPGGYDFAFVQLGHNYGYYDFDNHYWYNFHQYNTPAIAHVTDLVDAVYNPVNKALYIASHGYGLIEKKADGTYTIYNDTLPLPPSCYLVNALTKDTGGTYLPYVRIDGLAVDNEGNVWMTNHTVPVGSPSLHVKRIDGTCDSYKFNSSAIFPADIIIDDLNNKWIRLTAQNGILVFNEDGYKTQYITAAEGQGKLNDNQVTCLAKDKKGQIWAGTAKGISVFYDPSLVFSGYNFDASTPVYNNTALLYDEYITCLKVDGGNRKWIGTRNGAWLFNEDGTQFISRFTTENSPLLSDMILDIEINEKSGEVFFATDKGIVSYRGTATEAAEKFSDVKVFPNPAGPDYSGVVVVSGLVYNANVKFTDIYGNLAYETTASGGSAVWNLKDYNGRRVKPGIYLIFSASEDGTEKLVSKMAVVE